MKTISRDFSFAWGWNLTTVSGTMTITEQSKGALALALYYTRYDSPLGEIVLLATEQAVTGLWLPGQKPDEGRLRQAQHQDRAPLLVQGCAWLDRYFCGLQPSPREIRLNPEGSPFRRQVWARLCRIPYGQVETYGQLAKELAKANGGKMSAQAVGGAVGHNPISLMIPCHRVIGADGNLVGYNGGLPLKRRLLKYEGVDMRNLHDPKPRKKTVTSQS